MASIKILENIFWVGVNDRRNILFEGLWPIPQGVTYNSYIIKGSERIALVDTVDRFYSKQFISNIREVIDPSRIDYVILNHLEPDHSGALEDVLKVAPKVKVVGSAVAMSIAKAYYFESFEWVTAKDGDMISLGDLSLRFISAPWLHWPETIFTYDVQDQVLFSGDAFGTFGATDGKLFDDEININSYEGEMKRYFADIISHYSQFVIKAGEKIKDLPIKVLCTTHGLVYRKNPKHAISKYIEWSSGKDENKIIIVYGSMYEHTKELAEYFGVKLKGKGVAVKLFDLCTVHPSYVMADIIDAKVILFGTPTYEGQIFPLVSNMIEYMRIKQVRPKTVGVFANFSWGSNVIDSLKNKLSEIGMKIVEPKILIRGRISEEDKKKADILIENIIKAFE
ncbi:MAG: FprA family A-type flavoprotein [Nitrososphaeria archaeon]|jgi:flavorubredoxin